MDFIVSSIKSVQQSLRAIPESCKSRRAEHPLTAGAALNSFAAGVARFLRQLQNALENVGSADDALDFAV